MCAIVPMTDQCLYSPGSGSIGSISSCPLPVITQVGGAIIKGVGPYGAQGGGMGYGEQGVWVMGWVLEWS